MLEGPLFWGALAVQSQLLPPQEKLGVGGSILTVGCGLWREVASAFSTLFHVLFFSPRVGVSQPISGFLGGDRSACSCAYDVYMGRGTLRVFWGRHAGLEPGQCWAECPLTRICG